MAVNAGAEPPDLPGNEQSRSLPEEVTVECSPTFALLRSGVPLTLLIDLWPWDGPDSFDILRRETRAAQQLVGAA